MGLSMSEEKGNTYGFRNKASYTRK